MKKMLSLAMAVLSFTLIGANSASAAAGATSLKAGALGLNVGFGDSALGANGVITVSGRYFLLNDLALQAGVGMQASSGDLDAKYFSTAICVRKYFTTEEFAPFVEGKFSYISENIALKGVDASTVELSGNFGAEYFLNRQFSIEGSVGVGLGRVDDKISNKDYTYLGTHTLGLSANFYF